jgi:hypothetical protein
MSRIDAFLKTGGYKMKLFIRLFIFIALVFVIACLIDFFFSMDAVAGTQFNIKLIPPVILNSKAIISWHPAATATGYKAFAMNSTKTMVFVTRDTTVTVHCDSLLSSGIERVYFFVKAFNEAGDSAPSDTVSLPLAKTRFLFGDANDDSVVNVLDSALFWKSGLLGLKRGMPGYRSEWDINQDGIINTQDHVAFIINLGMSIKKVR